MNPAAEATVFVIDDDARMRAAMERLLKSVGLLAESFATPLADARIYLTDNFVNSLESGDARSSKITKAASPSTPTSSSPPVRPIHGPTGRHNPPTSAGRV